MNLAVTSGMVVLILAAVVLIGIGWEILRLADDDDDRDISHADLMAELNRYRDD